MIPRTRIWLLCLVLAFSWACTKAKVGEVAQSDQDAQAELSAEKRALQAGQEAYEAAETPAEKIAIISAFLEDFPESEEIPDLLETATRHLVDDMEDANAAVALAEQVLERTVEGETTREIQLQLALLQAKAGRGQALTELAQTMEADYELQFTDYLRLIEAAEEAETWELSMQLAEASLDLANPEAFKAQWPDMSDEESERFGARRVSYSYAHKGWALVNLGQAEEALVLFETALPKTTFDILGVDETPLHRYWGRTLLLLDEADAAMEKLVVEALHSSEPDALESYREAWTASRGSEQGLTEHLWQKRLEHARPLPSFVLPDYEGDLLDMTQFEGDVILVAAWFPT